MKYTRYDLRKENSNKAFIVVILIILVIAFILGTVIFKLLIRAPIDSSKADTGANIVNSKDNTKSVNNIAKESKITKFIIVQGGMYQSKENADTELNLLNQYGTPFSVTEDGKTRVFLGIYTEEQGGNIVKSLIDQKVDNSKMVFVINSNNICDAEIVEIINANIQILNKLSEKNVKAIQTDELKKWCSSLKKVDKNSKNISVLNDILDHVNKMPKELAKDKAGENYAYIYNVIKKIGSKQ